MKGINMIVVSELSDVEVDIFLDVLQATGIDNWEGMNFIDIDEDEISSRDYLQTLFNAGVDNWEGFDIAIDYFNQANSYSFAE